MSLTEPTSPAFDAGRAVAPDALRLAGSPSTWSYLRSLSGDADPSPSGAPEWADDERLDDLFSAWAEAALAADVVTDRGFLADEPSPARPAPDLEATAYEPLTAWSRSDDEIIPQRRRRGWGRRRR